MIKIKKALCGTKAQSTAEYAIIIGVIIAVALAMQTYVKRGIQARMQAASDKFYGDVSKPADWAKVSSTTAAPLKTKQYEPLSVSSKSTMQVLEDEENSSLNADTGVFTRDSLTTTQQAAGDFQKQSYP